MVRNTHDIVEDHFGVLNEDQLASGTPTDGYVATATGTGTPAWEPSGGGSQVLVSSDDTTPGYLEDKIEAGTNITLTVNNDGANETLEITSVGGGGEASIGRTFSVIGNECFFSATSEVFEGGITQSVSGTSAASNNQNTELGHPGIIGLTTGSTSTGRAALIATVATTSVRLSSGAVRFGATVKLSALSDGSNTYTVRMGLGSSLHSGDDVNAVFFRYTHGTNSGKWQACTVRQISAGSTNSDTTVTADTNWHTYEFEVNSAGTSVEYFIDGTSVVTITTFIPTGQPIALFPVCIQKSVGGTASVLLVDAYWYYFTLNR